MRYAVTIANLGSFHQAAEACFVTQPTLSMQVQKLEGALETVLFDRSKKPIAVTHNGSTFIEQFRRVLNEVDAIEEIAKADSHELTGSFRVGIIPTIAPILAPIVMQYFTDQYAKMQFELIEKTTEEIVRDLKSEQLDCGVLSTPLQESNLTESSLYQERLVVFHHPDLPLKSTPKLSDFTPYELILLSEQNCLRQQTLGLCRMKAKKAIEKNLKKFEAQNIASLFAMVRAMPSYCLIPESFTKLLTANERKKQIKILQDKDAYREIGTVRYRLQLKNRPFDALKQCIDGFSKAQGYTLHTKTPLPPT